jgi:hypothetical protein
MLTLVSRGTGIFIPFYLGIGYFIVGLWFSKRSFHDPSFTAQVFLFAAIITALHAGKLFLQERRFQGHSSRQAETIWSNSLLFLPVFVWAILFFGISMWNFFGR